MFFILAALRSINYSLRIITGAKSLIPEVIPDQEAAQGVAYSGVVVIARATLSCEGDTIAVLHVPRIINEPTATAIIQARQKGSR